MAELLSCPFCGAEPQLRNPHDVLWIVDCIQCGAQASSETDVRDYAIEAWNTRTPPSPPTPAMSQCRGINEDQAEAIYDAYEALREQQSGDRGRDGAIYRLGVAINSVLCPPTTAGEVK